jgi:DNA-binding NarL/FixJ family response regulator
MPGRPRPRPFSSLLKSVFGRRLTAYSLTPREACVAELVLRGLSNKEIAARCCISELTVKDHLKHIYRKTGAHQRTALLARVLGTLGA